MSRADQTGAHATERVRAALRESEERFRIIVESIQDYAIFMLDRDGLVQTWNAGAEKIKGYKPSEIIGHHFSRFYPAEDRWKCTELLETAEAQGRVEDEGLRVRKDGSTFWADVVITALHDDSGDLIGFAKVTRDLTERRRGETERLLLAEAEHANRAKDEFLATVSHELRTPLNAILGWAVLLTDRGVDPSIAKPLATIRRNAEAQAKIIEDVLDVSRIVTGKLRLDMRPIDFAAVVREAIEVVRPAADARRIPLVARGVETPARTTGDATRLQQVVWNLLSNAVKFSFAEKPVEIELTRDDALVLRVTDHGDGIEPSFLAHVFEPFRQADSSAARKHGGLGLGLAIVRHIVELHGGSAAAESAGLQKGSTFTVMLPIRGDAVAPNKTSASDIAEIARLDGLSIVVVDDDADSRLVVETALSTVGAKVRGADSAEAARALIVEERPDVLVTDIAMPEEDGYDLLEWVRAHESVAIRTIPAVAITALARDVDRARARAIGFDEHMAKPLDPRELVRLVRRIATR